MTYPVAPMCLSCAHLDAETAEEADHLRCDAFPEEIPAPIQRGEADHRKPYAGDGGVRFRQRRDLPRPPALDAFDEE